MRRIRAALITLILLAIAVHLMWVAIAPSLPFALGALVIIGVFGSLFYRRRRW